MSLRVPQGAGLGLAPALPANIKPDCKCLTVTNALAYFKRDIISALKKFYITDYIERFLA